MTLERMWTYVGLRGEFEVREVSILRVDIIYNNLDNGRCMLHKANAPSNTSIKPRCSWIL
jgi:hypothetical protein